MFEYQHEKWQNLRVGLQGGVEKRYGYLTISVCKFTVSKRIFRPGNGSPSVTNVVFVVVLVLVVICTKAFSFHNLSSSNFACRLLTILSTIAP